MSKFNTLYKQIISEKFQVNYPNFYIAFSLLKLKEENFCKPDLTYEDLIWTVNDFPGINISSKDPENDDLVVKCDNIKLLHDYLRTFINEDKFDQITAYIHNIKAEQNQLYFKINGYNDLNKY